MARGKAAQTKLKAKSGVRREYSVAKREEAVAQVEELGLTGAASKCGVPISTLFDWVKRAGKAKKRGGGLPESAAPEEAPHSGTKAGSVLALKRQPAKRYTPSQRTHVRNLIAVRLDGPGMRWGRDRAERVLHLRCVLLNGLWEEFASYIAARELKLRSAPEPARPYAAKSRRAA